MIKCPICNNSFIDPERSLETYVSSFNNQTYKLYHCKTCDLQWWEPLKILPEFYEMEGNESYELFHMGLREEIGENHRMFFKYIPLKSGKLLDVGCGDGIFLKEAQKAGFEVWGIDFDSKSIKVCQEKWGLKNTFVMSPQEFAEFCQKEGLKFDVITFFEVLEHQDKPVEFLEAIKSMLKPGGYIAGSVPNRELLKGVRKSLNYCQYNFPPHHFLWFNKSCIFTFLEMLGFYQVLVIEVGLKSMFEEIIEDSARLEYAITQIKGVYIREKVRKRILKTSYLKTSFYRKIIFKLLKILRNSGFLFSVIILLPFIQKPNLYFHGKLQ